MYNNLDAKKSVQDFQGQAMPIDQWKAIKGGQNDSTSTSDFIVMDDIMDG